VHYEASYNDTYNNLRPRLFDGSHLDFSGMNQTISLRPHQKDAVWRGMSSGNTLLAHVVGAGKTFTMAATGMKMKEAGLVKKPMYVVPNHLLEQFAREFMQLYPNARLLVAAKEDLTRDRRKMLTAKIASGEWDGIIVTHSSFERIGMSRDYQEKFLTEQIAEYDQLLREHAADRGANRNLIKTIEKQKAARVERLKDLLAENKKDDGLVFDELGVDHIFIDEAHYFNESCSDCSYVGQSLRDQNYPIGNGLRGISRVHQENSGCDTPHIIGESRAPVDRESLVNHNDSISKPKAWHRRRKLSGLEPGLTSRNPGGAPGSR
jgi:N12 class adenine-specific DNA methylase